MWFLGRPSTVWARLGGALGFERLVSTGVTGALTPGLVHVWQQGEEPDSCELGQLIDK